jgi:hypothetical protein
MNRKPTKKKQVQSLALPKGVKVVPAPQSPILRAWLAGADIQTSGGCRTVRVQHVR